MVDNTGLYILGGIFGAVTLLFLILIIVLFTNMSKLKKKIIAMETKQMGVATAAMTATAAVTAAAVSNAKVNAAFDNSSEYVQQIPRIQSVKDHPNPAMLPDHSASKRFQMQSSVIDNNMNQPMSPMQKQSVVGQNNQQLQRQMSVASPNGYGNNTNTPWVFPNQSQNFQSFGNPNQYPGPNKKASQPYMAGQGAPIRPDSRYQ